MRTLDHHEEDPSAGASTPLDARKAAILEAVVTEYVGTAQPVGSHSVANAPGVNVSSATVRSDMVALEQEGYLAQPHTSAGRIPTDKGYRFFVDHLSEPGVLEPVARRRVRQFFEQVHGEMEEVMERASGLLSELTSYAAVVVGPTHERAAIRSVQLVGLGPHIALLVVVLADGAVEKRSIEWDEDTPDQLLGPASTYLHGHLCGRTLFQASGHVAHTGDRRVDQIVGTALQMVGEMARTEEHEHVFVGGPSRLAGAFDAVETVRSVLAILEQQMVVVSLLREVLDSGLSVAIGTEHGYEPLASCAVVVARVPVGTQATSGAVGVLGPTRMNYPQAMAAAHVVGKRLGDRIGEALGSPDDEGGG
jgi:heat-inducible transcriptional repressor